MKFLYTPIVLLLFLFCGNSCNLINPPEPVPTYIHVDSFSFSGNPALTGTNSHKITCVYAYLNSKSVGIYDLPATFPVILDKKSRLQLTPGFDYNGFSGVPSIYPFYQSWSDSITPTPGQILTLRPAAKYLDATKLKYNVDFEGANPFSAASLVGSMTKTNVDSLKFEGNYSGLVYLAANEDSATNFNSDPDSLPALTDCYLEINYKSNIPFTVGLYTKISGGGLESLRYIAGFNPHPGTFNKVYIDLKGFVSTYQGGKITILLRAIKEDSQLGKPGYVAFDNIKIVSF